MVCHKHWLYYARDSLVLVLLFLLPYGVYRFLSFYAHFSLEGKLDKLATFLYLGWFLLLWTYFFIIWTDIYFDEWIVTDRRIINIEQNRLFHRKISDFRIEKIQNITVEVPGLVANMLGFGSIKIETAGEDEDLRFDMMPYPNHVRDKISECHDKCLAELKAGPSSAARYDLVTGE